MPVYASLIMFCCCVRGVFLGMVLGACFGAVLVLFWGGFTHYTACGKPVDNSPFSVDNPVDNF